MKQFKSWLVAITICGVLASSVVFAAEKDTKSEKAKPYPLKTCLVTGEKLGSMGETPSLIYKGQEIKFCCSGCVKAFKKDPTKYLKKMEEEQKKQS